MNMKKELDSSGLMGPEGYDTMTRLGNRLVFKLSAIILTIVILLSGALVYMQVLNTKKASEESIGNFSIHTAEAYAAQFDVQAYEAFLQDPQENDLYWSIREEMNRYRMRIGAMYVYTVKIDDQGRPILLIDGQPRDSDSASPIGEVTDIPAEAIEALLQGKAAKSGIIRNPEYGDYISAYAPLRDSAGRVIGATGIDTDVTVSQTIYREVIRDSVPTFVWMGIVALAFFALIVGFLSRSLRPLGMVVRGAEAMARGDLAEAKARLNERRIRSKDEIGQAYSAMMRMTDKLGVTLKDVMGDIALTAQNLAHSTDRFGEETERMVAMNEELERSVAALADGAVHQRLGAEQSAKAMEDITTAIHRASDAAASVSEASGEALGSAEDGKDSIRRLRLQVVSISDAAAQTTQSVQLLNAYMDEIEPALRSITEIADQTKLLALNASIEAARAGEHGAGFAVVAGEVRKLAEASSGSVMRIATLLHQIKAESARIGERMREGSEETARGAEQSDRAEALFHRAMEQFAHVNGQIQEISAVIQEVLASSEEAAASAEQISRVSSGNAESAASLRRMSARQLDTAKSIAETTASLMQRSKGLEAAIEKFKL